MNFKRQVFFRDIEYNDITTGKMIKTIYFDGCITFSTENTNRKIFVFNSTPVRDKDGEFKLWFKTDDRRTHNGWILS